MFDLPVYSLFYADSFLGILMRPGWKPGTKYTWPTIYIYSKQAGGYVGL